MDISALSRVTGAPYLPPSGAAKATEASGFEALLSSASKNAAESQGQAETLALQVATGQPVELHEAIIAMEQANLSLQFALQVRNKLVEAYQEVMRMQI